MLFHIKYLIFAGLKPGTVVVSEKVVNGELEPVYKAVSSEFSQINVWTKIAIQDHKTNQEYVHWAKQMAIEFSREYPKGPQNCLSYREDG